ncbi:ESX secretion-associated protein EspG [Nocardia sp. NPDC051570]|uniref:ESX secretion-associated protein EspG n=1 Tax=Nocardia sp. NPDC051570 TaxID=3364324 RepID=UPI0037909AD6
MTTLTNDELFAVAERMGVQTLPLVLAVAPGHESIDEWHAAQERAVTRLTDSGVLDSYGEVESELALALHALTQPERELVARIFVADSDSERPTRTVRVCVVRRGEQHAFAVRTGDSYDIAPVWADGSGSALARPILAALGACAPAEVASFSALAQELSERLDAADSASEYADTLYALGVADRDATVLGMAFAAPRAFAEIVAYTHDDGITTRSSGAVVVYDTDRGRIVAVPGPASDQRIWSTITPGTDHRIAQAISALIELLPGGRWLPP